MVLFSPEAPGITPHLPACSTEEHFDERDRDAQDEAQQEEGDDEGDLPAQVALEDRPAVQAGTLRGRRHAPALRAGAARGRRVPPTPPAEVVAGVVRLAAVGARARPGARPSLRRRLKRLKRHDVYAAAGCPVSAAAMAIAPSRLPGIPIRWNLATNGFAWSSILMWVKTGPVEDLTGSGWPPRR
jgi:hypothetical protein